MNALYNIYIYHTKHFKNIFICNYDLVYQQLTRNFNCYIFPSVVPSRYYVPSTLRRDGHLLLKTARSACVDIVR